MNNVYIESDIELRFKKVIEYFYQFYKSTNTANCLQNLHKLKFEDVCEQQIYKIFSDYLLKIEALTPGSTEIFIDNLINNRDIVPVATQFTKKSLSGILDTFCDETSKRMLLDCFELANIKSKIILSQHPVNGDDDLIEINSGCFFSELLPVFNLKSTKFLNCKILCIDGYIESVAEINKILNDAAESKETIIVFVRGLSEEVIHTLKINYDKGTLRVIPVIVKYDLDGVNLLNDIAVTNCSDVVSSLKGQLINSIDLSNINRVESIDITSSGVLIENIKASKNIDLHIKNLQLKLMNSSNDQEKDILTKRIQNLGSYRLTIRLKNDQSKLQRSLQIDRALRAIKTASVHGVCLWHNKLVPYASVATANFFTSKFKKTINQLGAIIC